MATEVPAIFDAASLRQQVQAVLPADAKMAFIAYGVRNPDGSVKAGGSIARRMSHGWDLGANLEVDMDEGKVDWSAKVVVTKVFK